MLDKDAILDRWVTGEPPALIAASFGCCKGSVYRIARLARGNGDARGELPDQDARDLYVARQHIGKIAEQYAKGIEVAAIAGRMGLPPHIVRAAVYIATQEGANTGLTLGA